MEDSQNGGLGYNSSGQNEIAYWIRWVEEFRLHLLYEQFYATIVYDSFFPSFYYQMRRSVLHLGGDLRKLALPDPKNVLKFVEQLEEILYSQVILPRFQGLRRKSHKCFRTDGY
jgi:hypothetical protein